MVKINLKAGERNIIIYSHTDSTDYPVVYTHASADAAESVISLLADIKVTLAVVCDVDWECDLSPWPASKAFRGGVDFTGGADAYLHELTNQIVPAVEETIGYSPNIRGVAGYSMAGLFALYALYRTDIFNRAASISGSLWYDGFLDFMSKNRPFRVPERVYFSLGDHEEVTKNQRLATVRNCTEEAEKLIQDMGGKTVFEMNEGNHFAEVPERMAKGLKWIL
jgi:predicted alpha/beta superfamily hydrolase